MDKTIYNKFGICDEIVEFSESIIAELSESFEEIDDVAEYNQLKVINAMQENRVNASCFAATTGYGYDDVGLYALLWTSSENESYSEAAYYYGLDYDSQDVARGSTAKDRRGSVRCLRD